MVDLRSGEPHSVICRLIALIAQCEDNLVFNVDGDAAEHVAAPGRQCGERFQHELVRDGLTLRAFEERVVRRRRGCVATGCRHRT